jgi:GNAT superfamily N-acetyltransferase
MPKRDGEMNSGPSDINAITLVIRPGEPADLPSWLELVREVEYLFGPMPEFAQHAERGMARGTALVVADGSVVHGAALLSRDDQPHRINWLAVRAASRRTGVGGTLMDAILNRWPSGDISVVTFGTDIPAGLPARHYYQQYGFQNMGATEPGPNAGSRDRYVRPFDSDHTSRGQ